MRDVCSAGHASWTGFMLQSKGIKFTHFQNLLSRMANMDQNMVEVSFLLRRDVFSALRQDPDNFIPELRLAAAVKWYELGMLSQSRAAEMAGLSRSEFLVELARFKVTPFQYGADEIEREVDL